MRKKLVELETLVGKTIELLKVSSDYNLEIHVKSGLVYEIECEYTVEELGSIKTKLEFVYDLESKPFNVNRTLRNKKIKSISTINKDTENYSIIKLVIKTDTDEVVLPWAFFKLDDLENEYTVDMKLNCYKGIK